MNYKKCNIIKTKTTTDGYINVFGVERPCIKPVYEITGSVNKPAGQRPFLTSISDCKCYVNEELA